MSFTRKIKLALRGKVNVWTVLLEALRRLYQAGRQKLERKQLGKQQHQPSFKADLANLLSPYSGMNADELLAHFRQCQIPHLFEGLSAPTIGDRTFLPDISQPLNRAREILSHQWPLLGFGKFDFGAKIDWLRDPVSGVRWPLDYHGDLNLQRGDGSDVRVLWELNRLGHLVTLGQAYAVSGEERFAEQVFADIESWRNQNPLGYGPNWACAMEVALRAMNLMAAFHFVRQSTALNPQRLAALLGLFEEHGTYIRKHLEFSFIATGNHYLSDIVGLLWISLYLPELQAAAAWRPFALKELLREMDNQVLPDGADCEASTGYHRFVTELFLYSFILCRANGIVIEEKCWQRLTSMLEYMQTYLRPDGRAPLIGDSDGGQALSLYPRAADEHAYLLGLGAVLFNESRFKIEEEVSPELFWLLGAKGVHAFKELKTAGPQAARSKAFEQAGTCVLRDRDLYLLLSAKGAGLRGRGAHGHNDALSIEVSAFGVSFLRDPGSYIYTGDVRARHGFRSTSYHSTIEMDGQEQNAIAIDSPFLMPDQAKPRIVHWESNDGHDLAVAEHRGYHALPAGQVTHRRAVWFDKRDKHWLIEDSLSGAGTHVIRFFFHTAPGREIRLLNDKVIEIRHAESGARLFIASLDSPSGVTLEPRGSSNHYGSKSVSTAACWTLRAEVPISVRWLLLPLDADVDEARVFHLIEQAGSMSVNMKSEG
ncbi:MAG: alginate lyase family protein [Acidobacteriia bacterium]|nr:alginate lyase family protein [Terriglobia bacterium]